LPPRAEAGAGKLKLKTTRQMANKVLKKWRRESINLELEMYLTQVNSFLIKWVRAIRGLFLDCSEKPNITH